MKDIRRIIILGMCLLAVIGGGALYLLNTKQAVVTEGTFPITMTTAGVSTTTRQTDRTEEVRVAPAGSREYRNAAYHYSIFYPEELTVGENDEGGGAMTITFQNEKEVRGFQIFIVPYAEPQVSEARFKQDIPSGVRTDFSNITVDGVVGASFNSTNAMLGETREVWFIRDGFLYEVTTLKSLRIPGSPE